MFRAWEIYRREETETGVEKTKTKVSGVLGITNDCHCYGCGNEAVYYDS